MTFLGTGTSAGVPMIGCTCPVCTSTDPRDDRSRPSVMLEYIGDDGRLWRWLIDTAPELRLQMIRHQVMQVDGVFYTHNHADHIFGIDDLRRFNAVMGEPVKVFAEAEVLRWMRSTFRYVFEPELNVNQSFIPNLALNVIAPGHPVELGGQEWLPVRLMHGRLPILGFRVGGMAYCTDCSEIPDATIPFLEGLDLLVIDALRYREHPTHLSVDQALAWVERLRPRRALFTHIAHEISHAELSSRLPAGVGLAYDGLVIEIRGTT
ncbi:MAG: MBL fold metallo-hydrolase [Verrucomicrobiota bacterium]|nr:MBL fold metallo-hydrolase [Verrucomicrobiota bacterium]